MTETQPKTITTDIAKWIKTNTIVSCFNLDFGNVVFLCDSAYINFDTSTVFPLKVRMQLNNQGNLPTNRNHKKQSSSHSS